MRGRHGTPAKRPSRVEAPIKSMTSTASHPIRLSQPERDGIRAAVAEVFGAEAVVRLFGSRTDPARRGGDIDLLVETAPGGDSLKAELKLAAALEARLGERKIDIVLYAAGAPTSPIVDIALRDGVIL